MERAVLVSVIIPALNEAGRIESCLKSLLNQTLERNNFEIIVVDNGSTDNTVKLSRTAADYVYIAPSVTVGRLRNIGVENSKGELLAFIDADCVASPEWLEAGIEIIEANVVAVGNKYDMTNGGSWIEKIWFGSPEAGQKETKTLWSGNLIVKKDAFVAVGGFDESLVSYEDMILSERLSKVGKLLLDHRVRVVHLGGPKTIIDFFRQQIWHEFEWPVIYRRGLVKLPYIRSTLASLIGCGLVLAAPFCSFRLSIALLLAGIALIVGPIVRDLLLSIVWNGEQKYGLLIRFSLLRLVHMLARCVAGVIRVSGFHWSGRRKGLQDASREILFTKSAG